MKRTLLIVFAAAVCVAPAAASPSKLRDIPQSYLFTPAGHLTPLHARATYRASKSGDQYFRGGKPPNFGWVHFGRGSASGFKQGLISIMTAYGRTPSVAATVNVLRTRGHGATYEATTTVKLAGYSGIQFDGQITGTKNYDHIGHLFIPFSPKSTAAKYYPDEYGVYGDVFRVIVLSVRGKTIVIYIENVALPADQFPTFLNKADQVLNSLRFPA